MKALKNLRKAAGLTQFELEHKVRVPRSKISLAESGQLALSEKEVRAICRLLVREIRKRGTRLAEALKHAEDLCETHGIAR
ncbi:MAG TPA: helix-turn-helix transcriptional regulator [Candidatus Acidoferrales bacterium]